MFTTVSFTYFVNCLLFRNVMHFYSIVSKSLKSFPRVTLIVTYKPSSWLISTFRSFFIDDSSENRNFILLCIDFFVTTIFILQSKVESIILAKMLCDNYVFILLAQASQ